jgi:protein-S-isoprenylcysteine O-methyltransferase Ste14
MAVLIDFVEYHQKGKVKTKVKSWVETGSMLVYYLLYYGVLKIGIGHLFPGSYYHHAFIVIGLIIMVTGCYVNVAGRLKLKHNWANQVTIYTNQTLVSKGVYRIVRHPLYASIIWMLIGGSLIYTNYIAFLSIAFIFIPMMYYRARQEEKVLSAEFKAYQDYKQKVGMFFPKLIKL